MKFIRVNMKNQTAITEDVPQQYAGLGGRGLTSILVNAEVPATCDPLGPKNKLVIAPGIISGTNLVNTSRVSVGAKSPLTCGIKESNAGGTTGKALGRLGITAIIIEGQAPLGKLYSLKIDEEGSVSLIDTKECKGMRTYAFTSKMLETHGEKTSVLCIGPAGENKMTSASIQASDIDGRPCRAAARGGLGAVMGAKGLKAVLIDQRGKNCDELADMTAFRDAVKAYTKILLSNPFCSKVLPKFGTAALTGIVNSMGAFPSYNATKGVMDNWENISGEKLAETMKERGGNPTHQGCSNCVIRCSNEWVDKSGEYVTASLEYETIWAMGGMTAIDDPDVIARMDYLCDDIGLDTMNTGVAIAVAMDAGYAKFGDTEAAVKMIEEVAEGTEIGNLIGNGPAAVGKHFKHSRVPVVKGQSIAAYDPRSMQGNGVTYATSPMGADHTAGNIIGEYLSDNLDPLKAKGQMLASRKSQIANAITDYSGLCLFADCLDTPEGETAFLDLLNAKYGTNQKADDLLVLGIKIIKAEREFNQKAGLTKMDDRLPRFFSEEPLSPHNTVFSVTDNELDTTLDL